MRVLVTEKLSDQGLELLRRDFEVDVRPELATGDLAAEIGPYEALIVRSQTRVDADVLAGRGATPRGRSRRASASTTSTSRPPRVAG